MHEPEHLDTESEFPKSFYGPEYMLKATWVGGNVLYLFNWIVFCSHVFTRWGSLQVSVRRDELFLLIAFGSLWARWFRKRGYLPVLIISAIVLMALSGVAR
jgi:hypothetical protein